MCCFGDFFLLLVVDDLGHNVHLVLLLIDGGDEP